MAVVGDLVATLTLNSSKFNKGIEQSRTRLQKFQRGVGNMRRDLVRAGKQFGIFAGIAATAMGAVTAKTLQTQDQLGKLARRLGATTEGLSKLQFAAEQTGVKTEALNMGLQRMVRRVAEAAKGTGEAKDAIKQLGLSATELSKLKPEEQFRRITGAMEGVESQSQKVRLAFKLFDSEGVSLLQTMSAGVEGLDQYARQAEETGSVITEKQAKAAAEARDAMNLLSRSFQGASNVMASSLAPAITAIANGFSQTLSKSLKDNRTAVVNWGKVFGDIIAFMADAGVGAVASLKFAFGSLGITIGGVAAAAVQAAKGNFSRANEILQQIDKDVQSLRENLMDTDLTRFRDELEKTRKKNDDLSDGISKAGEIAIKSGDNMVDAQEKVQEESEKTSQKVVKEAKNTAKQIQGPFDNAIENIQRAWGDAWTDIFRNGVDGFKGFADRVKDIFARLAGEIVSVMTTRAIAPIIEGFTGISIGGGKGGGIGSIVSGGGGGLGGIPGGGGIAGKIADGVAKKLGLGGAGAGTLVQRIGAKIGFAGDVEAVTRASQGTAKGLTAKLPGSLGGALAAAGGGIGGFQLGGLIGQRFGGERGGQIGGAFGGAVGSIAGPIGTAVGSAAGGFFGSGIDRLISSGSSTAERATGLLDVAFPGIGSLISGVLGIGDQSAPRLAALTAAERNTSFGRGFKGGPTETPFGFVGFSQAASETAGTDLSDNDLNKFENLIKGVDEQVAKFLTESQVEAVKKALQTRTGSRQVTGGGIRTRVGGEKDIGRIISDRFGTIFEAIGEEIPDALKKSIQDAKNLSPRAAIEQGLKPLQELFAQRVREITDELSNITSRLTDNARELLQFREGFGRAGESIEQQLFRMTGTSQSPLSPTARLRNARSQFEGLLGRAQGGDIDALQQISGSAQNFLGIARQNFASSPEFFQRFDFVQDALQGLQGVISQQQGRIDDVLSGLNVTVERGNQQNNNRLDKLIEITREQSERIDELNGKLERLAA